MEPVVILQLTIFINMLRKLIMIIRQNQRNVRRLLGSLLYVRQREAPSNPRWNVTPSGRLRRLVLTSPPPITARETPAVLGRAAGPLRAG